MPAQPHPAARLLPFAAAAAGVGFLSLMDALMKEAALATGTYTATVLRSLFGAAIIAPFWLAQRKGWPSRNVLKLHMERGIISAFMALSFFYALTKLPLAEAIAISFIAPLIALYFARVLLGERIRSKAVFASVLGLIGTLVIVGGKLGREELTEDMLLGLASLIFSAFLYAYNFVVIRRQSQVAGPVEIATFHSGVGGLVLLLFAPFLGSVPQASALWAIVGAGALTVTGAMAIAWAYARAEAQALVPLEYTGFLWASLFGWLFFREPVTLPTIAGTALIVTGCWIATRKPRNPPAVAAS
ncbi:DMT family transporter [Erythrobacter sp. THAF29]|uniref:DMT family transporter n=1 Tax=Erythrobacter sp. THAF29 TaxID=2587851 RepID=UPI0012A9B222|nr:DMT family transporter [Erythrobacter sp. THAF29]QFT78937.1 EamA-like transporter family protein [Erythrobacter sp. THAF29]